MDFMIVEIEGVKYRFEINNGKDLTVELLKEALEEKTEGIVGYVKVPKGL